MSEDYTHEHSMFMVNANCFYFRYLTNMPIDRFAISIVIFYFKYYFILQKKLSFDSADVELIYIDRNCRNTFAFETCTLSKTT